MTLSYTKVQIKYVIFNEYLNILCSLCATVCARNNACAVDNGEAIVVADRVRDALSPNANISSSEDKTAVVDEGIIAETETNGELASGLVDRLL